MKYYKIYSRFKYLLDDLRWILELRASVLEYKKSWVEEHVKEHFSGIEL